MRYFLLFFSIVSLSYSQGLDPAVPLELAPVSQPYSLPWQLRSVYTANLLRLDSASAFYKDKNGKSGGTTVASMITGSYKLMPELAVLARVGMVNNNPPAGAASATSLANPLLGSLYSKSLSDEFKMSFFMGVTLPVGSGGGNSPKPALQSANSAAILARSAMDNALLAVNYFAIIPGVDIAYVSNGVTIQLEATLLQLTRVRGENVDKDSTRTNFTGGLGLGYFISSRISAIGELRYQRWLNNSTVSSAPKPAKENLSFAIGPRFNLKLGTLTLKPGIAYAQGLVGPIANGDYTSPTNSQKIIFVDLPLIF